MLAYRDSAGGVGDRKCAHNNNGREAGPQEAGRSYFHCTQKAERAQKTEPSSKDPQAVSPMGHFLQQGSALSPKILQYPDWGPSVEIHEPLGHVLMLNSTHPDYYMLLVW